MTASGPTGFAASDEVKHEDLRIARALEDDIIFGRLAPGERLTEDSLLARFPTTRHFVRQALVKLEHMGLVVRQRNRGAAVRSLTPAEVEQLYDVRALIERQAALLIPLPAPASLISKLREIQKEHAEHIATGHLRGINGVNDHFHLVLYGASGNAYLVDTIAAYMRLSLPLRANSMSDPEQLNVSHQQHELMIDMLCGRDNWILAQLCVDHHQPAKKRYLDMLTDREGNMRRSA